MLHSLPLFKPVSGMQYPQAKLASYYYDEVYKPWAKKISDTLQESARRGNYIYSNCRVKQCRPMPWRNDFKGIRYAESTLFDSGCAPFCIAHALSCSVIELANELADNGYYCPGKGTWHHSIDFSKAQRSDDVQDIFTCLSEGRIITILSCGHFRNLIGISGNKFIVADSRFPRPYREPIKFVLSHLRNTWVW